MKLYKHQSEALEASKCRNKVAYFHDMGLGKTFTGSEKMVQLGARINLVICQKSKIDDWVEHFKKNYNFGDVWIADLTNKKQYETWLKYVKLPTPMTHDSLMIGVINYELAFRRPELMKLKNFTLMLDESSLIQNEKTKRSKFIRKLNYENLILLSGTPCNGKYENLWSQLKMLGWNISKDLYWKHYINYVVDNSNGFPIVKVLGYKNVDRLKLKMRHYGCQFLKTEDVFDLPEQIFNDICVDVSKEYKKFRKSGIVSWEETFPPCNDIRYIELVGDTSLTQMLYERQLCGQYNKAKLEALKDLLQSSDDRIIIFYNFNEELYHIEDICEELNKPVSIVNGKIKDLSNYENQSNSVSLIQYQAGSMGLNLQKSNKIIYFTPPLSSELFEQSKKRTHRIGQNSTCFYYMLKCRNSIEEKIYDTLALRKDYTDELFKEDINIKL